jgi:hypothetical protein
MTLSASRKSTCSPGSGDGPAQLDLLAGLTPAPSGPHPAPVSRSRSRAKAPVETIHGICGPTSFASPVPAGPLHSWESRLRERLAMIGSTESPLIWKLAVTPAGRSMSRLARWTPPISEAGSIGSPWRTPNAQEPGVTLDRLVNADGTPWTPGQRAYDKDTGRLCQVGLPQEMEASDTWPTPTSLSGGSATSNPPGNSRAMNKMLEYAFGPDRGMGDRSATGLSLQTMQALQAPWSTPRASDGEKGAPNQSFGAGGQPLPAQLYAASPWTTPLATDPRQGYQRRPDDKLGSQKSLPTQIIDMLGLGENVRPSATTAPEPSGPITNGSPATTAKRGGPSPAFPCWLMGYGEAWLWCVPTPSEIKALKKKPA